MSDPSGHNELIIVRRHEEEEHDAHSSAWKVAHADFMTAMMAFFLIMWLVNVTDDEVKKSIANYFNPMNLTTSVSSQKGLNEPSKKVGDDKGESKPDAKPDKKEKKGKGAPGTEGETKGGGAPADAVKGETTSSGGAVGATGGGDGSATAEMAAFQDPYAVLAKLAAEVPPSNDAVTADTVVGETGSAGVAGGTTPRDPFDPVYWQTAGGEKPKTANPGAKGTSPTPPPAGAIDAAATDSQSQPGTPAAVANANTGVDAAGQDNGVDAAGQEMGAATADAGADPASAQGVAAIAGAAAMANVRGAGKAASIAGEVNSTLQSRLAGKAAPHIEVTSTGEGVLVSLTDDINYSMFPIGSAVPDPRAVVAMETVAKALAKQRGDIVIRGFTDGRPFRSKTYDNWRLSSARAQMAYYMLTRGDLDAKRVLRIEGHADRELKNPKNPNAPENRRIEILLREPST